MTMSRLAYYVTAHGFGHGVRTCDILNALLEQDPELHIDLVTALPASLFRVRVHHMNRVHIRVKAFDAGMIQLDSVQVDVEATLHEIQAIISREPELTESEARWLKTSGVFAVAADIPGIPIRAAKSAGLPAVAIGNFGWDWIYSAFAENDYRWRNIVDSFAAAYAQADLLLRLPFAEKMKAFPKKEDLPLLADPGIACREEIAKRFGCDLSKKWALISFTSLDLDPRALARIAQLAGYEFLVVEPMNWNAGNIHAVPRDAIPFSSLLASSDAVITKPGFGIMSECVANGKPMIYTDRKDFIEYPVMVENIKKYMRAVHIPQTELYAGNLAPFLAALEKCPPPKLALPSGGAKIAAKRILGF